MLIRRLAAAALLAGASLAHAQDDQLLKRYHPKNWTLMPEVTLKAVNNFHQIPATPRNPADIPQTDVWQFQAAAVVFPIAEQTASSVVRTPAVKGELTFEGHLFDDTVEILRTPYHSGTELAKFTLEPLGGDKVYRGSVMRMRLEIPAVCYRTEFDEEIAKTIGWPQGELPDVAASTFDPMNYVDYGPDGPYDMSVFDRILKKWVGSDPTSQPPVVLAKWVAGQLAQSFQISGNGLNASRSGMLEGIDIRPGGAPEAAARMRGNEFEMALVLTALYRRAGIPARFVAGYDAAAAKGEDGSFLSRKRSDLQIRAWVEFALYDEDSKKLTWIPVDVAQIRKKRGSRLPNDWVTEPLKYFGTNDELDGIIPIAFQLHPPTNVRAYGSPGFWGWGVFGEYPPPGAAWQEIRIQAITTPTRAGDEQQERNRRGRGGRGR